MWLTGVKEGFKKSDSGLQVHPMSRVGDERGFGARVAYDVVSKAGQRLVLYLFRPKKAHFCCKACASPFTNTCMPSPVRTLTVQTPATFFKPCKLRPGSPVIRCTEGELRVSTMLSKTKVSGVRSACTSSGTTHAPRS